MEEEVRDGVEVKLAATRHRKDMLVCFGLFNDLEDFSVLLDQLDALLLFRFDQGLFCVQNLVARWLAAVLGVLWVHVGP